MRVSVERAPRVARRVGRLRELRFAEVPKPEVLSGAELGELERREGERRGGAGAIGADEAVMRILGLLDPDEQLEAATAAGADLAAAAYDPRTGRLYVVSDAVAANPALVEFVLAHELTHAIEDQAFGLTDAAASADDDAALARLALSEGTATSLMVLYAARHLSPLELAEAAAGIDPGTGEVPEFVVEQLEWAYTGGMTFVEELRELADGWKLVDHAIADRPPRSTEQVLHPLKYVRDERPVAISIRGAELRRRGWRRATSGVAGEQSTAQLLGLGAGSSAAAAAAAGWAGDRYELWRRSTPPTGCAAPACRSALVLVARWRFDRRPPGQAAEFERAATRYLIDGLGAAPGGAGYGLEGGFAALSRRGREVALVFAPRLGIALALAKANARRRAAGAN